ncbi:hypothetical protein AA0614_0196 [Komagataeibacter saccharivorans NRIC 0614]|nr:hypothetical protein AA0614_0196 [Komagataeibacter saccharivorans NRIC 0614]
MPVVADGVAAVTVWAMAAPGGVSAVMATSMAGGREREENHKRIMVKRARIRREDFGMRSFIWYNIT